MRSPKKISIRLLKAGLIFLLTLYVGLFLYLKFGWRNYYSKPEVNNIITTIQNAPTLSGNLYKLYDKTYKDRHERITTRYWKGFWIQLNAPIKNNWQYVTANIMPYKGFRYKIAPMTLAFRINSDVSPEKCFDYIMTERYENYCREFKIKDTITNLVDTGKIVSFLIANERPWFYRRHPIQYKSETDSLKLVLSKL